MLMLSKFNTAISWMNSSKILNKSKAEEFRFSWLRLARTVNVGAKTFFELMKIYTDPQEAINNISILAERGEQKEKN